ncbi:hypothetical protein HYU20_00680 [Candidatus Woesearchaeota archaeon]|nr:hypothetical protein [Candidatus Woesearchaeota archaeon]
MSYSYEIDSSAWIEYFGATAKGLKIKQLIEQEEIATSMAAFLEVADKFERENRRFDVCRTFMHATAMQENSVLVTADFNFAGLENVMVV